MDHYDHLKRITPFAAMGKEARVGALKTLFTSGPGAAVKTGIEGVGRKFKASGLLGQRKARMGGGSQRDGKARNWIGDKIVGGSNKIGDTMKGGMNVAALGGAGYGAHALGRNTGRGEVQRVNSDVITNSYDQGLRQGVEATNAAQPGDPGFLGKLMELFSGRQKGPDNDSIYNRLSSGEDRDAILKSLTEGY